jgi:hypothetical protein
MKKFPSEHFKIDVYKIFANEYIKRINENKTLQKCTFLMKVKNNIINAK